MQEFSLFIANHLTLAYTFAGLTLLLVIVEALRNKGMNFRIDTTKAIELINRENAAIVDIRSSELYRKGHVLNAISIPSKDILQGSKKIERLKNNPVIVVCQMGVESQKIAGHLIKNGYQAYSLNGGTRGWSTANLPTSKE